MYSSEKWHWAVLLVVIAVVVAACGTGQQPAEEAPAASSDTEQEAPAEPQEQDDDMAEEPTEAPAEEPADEPTEEPAEEPADTAEDRSPVVIAVGGDVDTFDPAQQSHSLSMLFEVFDQLLSKDENGNLQPEVATEWKQIDEATWEFKIREGIVAHNGEVIDANDVAYSLNRVLDPEIEARGHYLWLAGNMRLKGAEAVDDYTVHLFTDGQTGGVPGFLWTWHILPQDYYESTPLDELARHPVGSGPYELVEANKGDSYVLQRFEDWWGEPREVESIIYRIIPEMGTRISEFNTGGVDILRFAPPPDLQDQIDTSVGRVVNVESLRRQIYGYAFYNDPAIQDKNVRLALNYAVPRQQIIDGLLEGMSTPNVGFVNPPDVHPDLEPYPYDPDRALELLAEAGYEDRDGDGFIDRPDGSQLELVIQTPEGVWVKDAEIAQVVAASFEDIGIATEVLTTESSTYINQLATAKAEGDLWFQAANGGYGCQADASDFSTHTEWQPGDWLNEEFDATFDELTSTVDPEARQELCYRLQEILYEEAPLIPLWNQPDPYALSNRIDWTPEAHGRNDFSTMKWAK